MSRRLSKDGSVWMYEDEDRDDEEFTEEDLQNGLAQLITEDWTYGSEMCWENLQVRTFADAGIMTLDKGLVVTLPDGSEYTLTITRRR